MCITECNTDDHLGWMSELSDILTQLEVESDDSDSSEDILNDIEHESDKESEASAPLSYANQPDPSIEQPSGNIAAANHVANDQLYEDFSDSEPDFESDLDSNEESPECNVTEKRRTPSKSEDSCWFPDLTDDSDDELHISIMSTDKRIKTDKGCLPPSSEDSNREFLNKMNLDDSCVSIMKVDSFHLEFSTRLCYDMNESFAEEMEICVTFERIGSQAYGFNVGNCMQYHFQTVPRNFAFGSFDNEMLSTSEVCVEDSMMDISCEIQSYNGFGYNQAQHVWLHNTSISRQLETQVPMDIGKVVNQSEAAVDIKLAVGSSHVTEACVSSFNPENSDKRIVAQLSELKTDNHTELSLDCCTQL